MYLTNHVRITPHYHHYEHLMLGDTEIKIATEFDKENYAPVTGTVVTAPDVIKGFETTVNGKKFFPNNYNELQPGDVVLFAYNDVENAQDRGKTIGKDVFILYQNIYAYIRDGVVTPINDTVIVKADVEEITSSVVFIPKSVQGKKSLTNGTVVFAGKPLTYRDCDGNNVDQFDYSAIVPGAKVIFSKYDAVEIENTLHQLINKGEHLYYMKFYDVHGVVG